MCKRTSAGIQFSKCSLLQKEKKKKAQPSVLVIIVHSSFPPSRKTSALSVGKDLVDAKIINQYEKIPDSP
jgi:hypothetical protein